MHHITLHLIGYNHVNSMPLAQTLFIKILLHREACAEQTDFSQTRTTNILCGRIGNVQQGNRHRRLDLWRNLVHGVGTQHDAIRSRARQGLCRLRQ